MRLLWRHCRWFFVKNQIDVFCCIKHIFHCDLLIWMFPLSHAIFNLLLEWMIFTLFHAIMKGIYFPSFPLLFRFLVPFFIQ